MKRATKLIALNLALVLLLSLLPGQALAADTGRGYFSAGTVCQFTPTETGFYRVRAEITFLSTEDDLHTYSKADVAVYQGGKKLEPVSQRSISNPYENSYTCELFLQAGVTYTLTGGGRDEALNASGWVEKLTPSATSGTAEVSYSKGSMLTYTPVRTGWYESQVARIYDAGGNELGSSCYLVVGRVYFIIMLVYVPVATNIFAPVEFPALTPETPVKDRDIVTFTPAAAGTYTVNIDAAVNITDVKIYSAGSETPVEVRPVINGAGGTVTYYFLADVVYYIYIYVYGRELGQGEGLSVSVAEGGGGVMPFTDVALGAWYYAPILFVFETHVMTGVDETIFAPETSTTRAMLMTILARLEGVEIVESSGAGWYEPGLRWAVEQKISDGTYAMDNITREQIAVMLYRHAGEPETTGTLDAFPDGDQVSPWAQEGLCWAVEKGIILGAGGYLFAQNTAMRCEMATMLQRYIENVVTAG